MSFSSACCSASCSSSSCVANSSSPVVQPAALLAMNAEFLRQTFATANTYAQHAGDKDVLCYDIVCAMRRELMDPNAGAIAQLKPLFLSLENASAEQAARLNEHVQGAEVLAADSVDAEIVDKAMTVCMTTGVSLSDAVVALQQDYSRRAQEKEERQRLIAADPLAAHIFTSSMQQIEQTKQWQEQQWEQEREAEEQKRRNPFPLPRNGQGVEESGGESGEADEDEEEEGEEEEENPLLAAVDDGYAITRREKCHCNLCSSVTQAEQLFAQWQPADVVDQHMFELGARLALQLFEEAEDMIEEEEADEDEEDDDEEDDEDYVDDDGEEEEEEDDDNSISDKEL